MLATFKADMYHVSKNVALEDERMRITVQADGSPLLTYEPEECRDTVMGGHCQLTVWEGNGSMVMMINRRNEFNLTSTSWLGSQVFRELKVAYGTRYRESAFRAARCAMKGHQVVSDLCLRHASFFRMWPDIAQWLLDGFYDDLGRLSYRKLLLISPSRGNWKGHLIDEKQLTIRIFIRPDFGRIMSAMEEWCSSKGDADYVVQDELVSSIAPHNE